MKKDDAYIGMKVTFLRGHRKEVIRSEIIKLNPKKAKVKTLVPYRDEPAGEVWNVPYRNLRAVDPLEETPPTLREKLSSLILSERLYSSGVQGSLRNIAVEVRKLCDDHEVNWLEAMQSTG